MALLQALQDLLRPQIENMSQAPAGFIPEPKPIESYMPQPSMTRGVRQGNLTPLEQAPRIGGGPVAGVELPFPQTQQPVMPQDTGVGSVYQGDFYGKQPQQEKPFEWYEMKSGGGKITPEDTPWYKDRELMTRLALGFNTMRLTPDQSLAAVLSEDLKDVRAMKRGTKTASAVSAALRAKGMNQEADLVENNPELAKEYAKLLTKGSTDTETVQTRKQIAAQLGYAVGSPEYNTILSGGKPSDISKEEWEKSKSIRGEFVAIPAVKSFSEQSQAFGRIVASAENPSPAGDLALIFNYMKILDPGSTVREGEFANAQNAGGVDDRIVSLYNQVIKGTRLSEPQRADFVGRAERLYKNAEQGYEKHEKFYRGVAERSGLKPEDVIPDYRYGGSSPPRMLVKPAEVPQATWDAMTQDQKKRFLEAGR